MRKALLRKVAKGNEEVKHLPAHSYSPARAARLVRTLRVDFKSSTNQRSSAANTVPTATSANQIHYSLPCLALDRPSGRYATFVIKTR
jgi:hypothetical protein